MVAILPPTASVELYDYWSHLNLLQSPSREAWQDKRCQGAGAFLLPLFSHLESVTEPKKVGSKVWGVDGSGSKHPLNAVALWQSAQSHHLVSEGKIQRGYRLEHE